MDCVHGESFEEITRLFKLQTKPARQQLRTGFKTMLNDFRVTYSYIIYICFIVVVTSFRKIYITVIERLRRDFGEGAQVRATVIWA